MKRSLFILATSLWAMVAVAVFIHPHMVRRPDQSRKISPEVLATVPFAQEAGSIAYSLSAGHGFSAPFRKATNRTDSLARSGLSSRTGNALSDLRGVHSSHVLCRGCAQRSLFHRRDHPALFRGQARWRYRRCQAWRRGFGRFSPMLFVIPFEWIWDTSSFGSPRRRHSLGHACSARTQPSRLDRLRSAQRFIAAPRIRRSAHYSFSIRLAGLPQRKSPGPWVPRPLLAATVAVLCCLPWTIRNYGAFHPVHSAAV